MTECCAEDFPFSKLVGPDYDKIIDAITYILSSASQRSGRRKQLNVVVKLFSNRRPVSQRLGDRMISINERHVDRLLWAVGRRLNSYKLKPVISSG